jgi:hypothetical protein
VRASFWIRPQPHYRAESFRKGLEACGFEIRPDKPLEQVHASDVLVIWNRYGWFDGEARRFEAAGARVLVAENGYLGNEFAGDSWYAISLSQHNGAGRFPMDAGQRWSGTGARISDWRVGGEEIVVLPQRGIGPQGVAMPSGWSETACSFLKGHRFRVRSHPGTRPCAPLEDDLARAKAVVTWGSGAALKALLMGIPCFHGFGRWIGAAASTQLQDANWEAPQRPDRLQAFQRIACAMWRLKEIESGAAFRRLLQ